MKIEKIHALIRTNLRGEEEILHMNIGLLVVEMDKQEREWSCIQNTGSNRTDLSIVTFERKV